MAAPDTAGHSRTTGGPFDGDLQAEAGALFADIVAATRGSGVLVPVAEQARDWLDTFAEPMRVAVAGEIKCGKSTLVNALIGADAQDRAVATGQQETTYVITELVHGHVPGIVVRYRDGRTTHAPIDRLRRLTVHRESGPDDLDSIDRVVVTVHAPLLHGFRLIDTPGFNSAERADRDTFGFLTSRECDRADAMIYTIANRGLTDISQEVAEQFTSGGRSGGPSPMKAIGVMPRANEHWNELVRRHRSDPSVDTDPFRTARREIDAVLTTGGHGLFHTVVPVDGLLGQAAALATDDHLALLTAFHELDDDLLATALVSLAPPKAFGRRTDFPLDPTTRQRLVSTFGPWGLWTAVRASRDAPSRSRLRQVLDERSGVAGLRDLIGNHFGGRAGTLRVREALTGIRTVTARHRHALPDGGPERDVLSRVGTWRETLEMRHRARFTQIDVLGQHYRGTLALDPTMVADLLRLTGEHGADLCTRLGVSPGAAPATLRRAARAAATRWAACAAAGHGRTRRAAEDMQRVCDAILHHLTTLPPDS